MATAVMTSCNCIILMKIFHKSSLGFWTTRYHLNNNHLALAEIFSFSDHKLGSEGKVSCRGHLSWKV